MEIIEQQKSGHYIYNSYVCQTAYVSGNISTFIYLFIFSFEESTIHFFLDVFVL